MNKMARATGITVLAVLVGMGLGACSAESPKASSQTTSVSPSVTAPSQSPDSNKVAVKSEMDGFFADVAKETKAFVAEMKASQQESAKLSKDQQVEKVRSSFKDSFSRLDESKIGTEKSMPLIGIFAARFYSTADSELTVEDSGITVEGDSAIVDGAHINLKVGDKSELAGANNSPGKFTLERSSGGWKITNFEPVKTAADAPTTAPPSE